jgi:hypothetical protein
MHLRSCAACLQAGKKVPAVFQWSCWPGSGITIICFYSAGFTAGAMSCSCFSSILGVRFNTSHAGGAAGRGAAGAPLSNRDLLKAKLQKDKFMTKPLSEIVASETEVCTLITAANQVPTREFDINSERPSR